MDFNLFDNQLQLEKFYESEIPNSYNELNCIKAIFSIEEWQSMSLQKKFEYRKSYISTKTKLNQDEKNLVLEYEISVVRFSSLVISLVENSSFNFEKLDSEEIFFYRLRNLFVCELYILNRYKKIIKNGHIPKELVDPIFREMKNLHCRNDYNLREIYLSYINMLDLYKLIK